MPTLDVDRDLLSPSSQEQPLSDEELLDLIAARISDLWERQPDFLLSMLYRLDVEEHKINQALHPSAPEPAYLGLARLVLERQQQRWATKRATAVPPPPEGWEF